jgi:hypothetical protein
MPAEWSSPIDFRIRQPDFGTLRERWLEMERKVCVDLGEAGEVGLQRIVRYRLMSGKKPGSPFDQMAVRAKSHLHQSSAIRHL